MTPTWRWFLGGLLWSAFAFGGLFIPGYLRMVGSIHLLLMALGLALLMAVSRCAACGYPVWMRRIRGGGYLFGPPGKVCSNCGEPV